VKSLPELELLAMDQLSCADLKKFLQSHGLHEVATAIVDNEVSGLYLAELTELEIKELAPKIGDRVKLRRLINQNKVSLKGIHDHSNLTNFTCLG